jgi:arylamine N-acetyltransferase
MRPDAHPLEPPRDTALSDRFRSHFDLRAEDLTPESLASIADAFSRIPYENLTKILRWNAVREPAAARRGPSQVLDDFQEHGAGGTCFALTATLLHLLRAAGWEAAPILADRRYGADTHCALLVRLHDIWCLLDPGYLINRPVPLSNDGPTQSIATPFNQLELAAAGAERWDLFTASAGNRRLRLTYKTTPASEHDFLAAWNASFGWDMMRYPVLTRVDRDTQTYLRDLHLQRRTRTGVSHEEVAPHALAATIEREFGLSHSLVEQALRVLG